jgi:hypothetical protein
VSRIDELLEEARGAHRRLHGITIRGEGWSGDPRKGFLFLGAAGLEQAGEGTPAVFTGACCLGEACSVLSAADCATAGGVYLGDFTTCFPNPCVTPPETGACCVDGECSILTLADCEAAGGDWFADTPCDPNPCALPPCCPDSFDAFDGSGRKFLTQTTVLSGYSDAIPGPGASECNSMVSASRVEHYDESCDPIPCECTGEVEEHFPALEIDCVESATNCTGGFDPRDPTHWGDSRTAPGVVGCATPSSCGSCCSFTVALASDSPTERVFDLNLNPGCDESSLGGTVVVTLSDECQP